MKQPTRKKRAKGTAQIRKEKRNGVERWGYDVWIRQPDGPRKRSQNSNNLEKHLCRRATLKNPKHSTRNTSLSLSLLLDGVSRKAQSTPANVDRTHCTRFDSADQFVSFAVRLKLWKEIGRLKQPNGLTALLLRPILDHAFTHIGHFKTAESSQLPPRKSSK